MGTITGTLTVLNQLGTSQKKQEFHACTKNIRAINEIYNLRLLGNRIQDLRTHCQEQEQKQEQASYQLGTKMKDLGIMNKIKELGM